MKTKTCGSCKWFHSNNPFGLVGNCLSPKPMAFCGTNMLMHQSEGTICPAHTEREAFCEWEYSEDVGSHITSCGEEFVKESEGPLTESDYNFCPNCGKPIKIQENEE